MDVFFGRTIIWQAVVGMVESVIASLVLWSSTQLQPTGFYVDGSLYFPTRVALESSASIVSRLVALASRAYELLKPIGSG